MPSRIEIVQAIRNELVLPANGDDRLNNGMIYFRMNQIRAQLIRMDYEAQWQRFGLAAKFDYDPQVDSYPIEVEVKQENGYLVAEVPGDPIDFPVSHGIQNIYFENPNNKAMEPLALVSMIEVQMRRWFIGKRAVRFGNVIRIYGVPMNLKKVYMVVSSDLDGEDMNGEFFDWQATYRIPAHLVNTLIQETVKAFRSIINGPKDELNDGNPIVTT